MNLQWEFYDAGHKYGLVFIGLIQTLDYLIMELNIQV